VTMTVVVKPGLRPNWRAANFRFWLKPAIGNPPGTENPDFLYRCSYGRMRGVVPKFLKNAGCERQPGWLWQPRELEGFADYGC
jgi:hypothetical protein